jgi:hypothetical protein
MAGFDELVDDMPGNEAGGAGDENFGHGVAPFSEH